jgi:lipoate-protein ligase A
VINLKELRPDLNLSMMKKALYRSFLSIYLKEENPEVPEPYLYYPSGMTELRGLYSKYSSWEWIYGKSPQFDMNISKRFDWGGIEFAFSLRNAIIRDLIIYSDVMETELVTLLAESLKGINFNLTDIITAIDSVLESLDRIFYDRIKAERMISDIKNWFKEIM